MKFDFASGGVSYLLCCRRNSLAESLPVFVFPAEAGTEIFLLCLIESRPALLPLLV